MKKVKKLSGVIFALLIGTMFMIVYGMVEQMPEDDLEWQEVSSLNYPSAQVSAGCFSQDKNKQTSDYSSPQVSADDFSKEKTEKIKSIIKSEFDKFYEEKNQQKINDKIEDLNQKLEQEQKRSARYKHKLHLKKNYASPETVQSEIDKVKVNLVLEFNKYFNDYINNAENKEKKLKHFDLSKIFSGLINLNFTFNNPKDININPALVKAEAKATIAGAAIGC